MFVYVSFDSQFKLWREEENRKVLFFLYLSLSFSLYLEISCVRNRPPKRIHRSFFFVIFPLQTLCFAKCYFIYLCNMVRITTTNEEERKEKRQQIFTDFMRFVYFDSHPKSIM